LKKRSAFTLIETIITLAIIIMIFSIGVASWIKATNTINDKTHLYNASLGIIRILEKARYESVKRQEPIGFKIDYSGESSECRLSALKITQTPTVILHYTFPEDIDYDISFKDIADIYYFNGYLTEKKPANIFSVKNESKIKIFSKKSDLSQVIKFEYGLPEME